MTPTCISLKLGNSHYDKLSAYLNDFPKAARPIPTLLFVKTNKDASQIRDEIKNLIDINDSVFVFTKEHYASANIDLEEVKIVQQIWLQ